MELQITKDNVPKKCVRYMGTLEENVETIVNLPDYCPQINKTINTVVQANLNSVWANSGNVVADGVVCFRMLYSTDEGKCEVYETSVPFTKKIDIPDARDTDIVTSSVSCEQKSCRVSGPRCAELKCALGIEVKIEYLCADEIVSSCSRDNIKKLENSFTQKTLAATAVNSFTVSDSFDSRSGNDGKVYRTDVTPCINEYKCIKNKIMIKGIYLLKIVMLNDDGELCTQNESIQFSQVFDINSVDENSICTNKLKVSAVNISFSSDRTLQRGRFEVSVTSEVKTDVYNDINIRCIEDAFSCESQLDLTFGDIKCADIVSLPPQLYSVNAKIDISAYPQAKIADIAVGKVKYNSSLSNGKWTVNGNIYFDVILNTSDSGFVYIQRAEDFSFDKEFECDCADVMSEAQIYINNMTFSLEGQTNIVISVEFNALFSALEYTRYKVVTDMSESGDIQNKNDTWTMDVYFAEKGESVWAIAKSHMTDPQTIATLNELKNDVLTQDKMLVFPV